MSERQPATGKEMSNKGFGEFLVQVFGCSTPLDAKGDPEETAGVSVCAETCSLGAGPSEGCKDSGNSMGV